MESGRELYIVRENSKQRAVKSEQLKTVKEVQTKEDRSKERENKHGRRKGRCKEGRKFYLHLSFLLEPSCNLTEKKECTVNFL